MDRRNFVKSVGASAVGLSVAGCMGGGDSEATEVAGGEGTTAAATETTAETETETEVTTTGDGEGAGNATDNETELFDDITGEVDQQDPNLEITSHDLTRQESTTYVTGTVENAGEEDIESVEVSVTLYDSEDNELFNFNNTVEEEEDVQRLAPGEAWDFRVQFEDIDMQNVARYVIRAESDLV